MCQADLSGGGGGLLFLEPQRAPAQSEARVLWYVRTAELRTAPLWLTGQATHRRTLLELLAAMPVLSP